MARPEEKLRCTKEPFIEDVGTRRIKSIRFSMFSGNEIRQSAEVQVWNNRIYGHDMKPVPNGLLDTRMGAANKLGECSTCHGSFAECPGHFGYLKLALPVFNVGFFNCILDVLKCICKSCSRVLLVEKDRREFLKKMRNPRADALQKSAIMKKVRDKCKLSRCPWCGYINGVAKKGRAGLIILHDCSKTLDGSTEELRSALSHKKEKISISAVRMLDPVTVLSLFRRMSDEDCELLNLGDRPEKLIVTEIAVPPVPIRPSVFVGGGRMSNEDSITVILKNIANTNSILKDTLQTGGLFMRCFDCWQFLQLQVVEYINSDAPCLPESQHRGLVQRLKGKTGRFRGNLSGKRTEYTGRTVISPDPNLRITEVAVPVLMARVLTYPERVSYYNIEKLRQCIRNGPHKHPGANFIIQPDGTKLHLKYCDRRIAARDLKYGCIVERHLEDGDIVLFNRQPSLHRMSIMSHRARIMPWRTLRFNESVCNPYNADFDGDEMNLHVPQTEEARTEALMLMGVQNNLCTPKNGEILVASTQDFLTSSFLVTRKDTFYDRSSFTLLCSYLGDAMEDIDLPTPALIKPIELWTGKQLFGVLVRPNASTKVFLNLTVKEKIYTTREAMCPNDGFVYFRNSELLSGQVGKATLGSGNKDGMFYVLVRDYNSHAAASCMNRLAKFSARFIGNHGFSIGVDDVQPGEHLNQQKKKKIDEGYKECHDLIASYSKGVLTLQPGCNAAQTLELKITGVLNQIRATAGNVCMDTLHWRNSPLIMSQCGSKGSPINISQMVACVGQQSVGGRRAPNGFIDRTLPHFPINSKTPADVLSARIVKGSIEKAVLGELAAAIKIVLKSCQPNLVVKLDMQRIEALHMGVSSDSVQLSILNHPKIKLKSEHVRVIDKAKLRIYPAGTDKCKLQYELHNLKSMLPKVIVKGIPTVERAVINKTGDRYNLLVEGTNLLAVMGTPGVDAMKTKSNHIMEVNRTLGIEAARRSIIDEIQYTMKSHGMNIDLRHMMLLADLMTYKGEILGITRYGIAKMKSSVLMLASFEKTSEHLFNASYSGREDQIEGVSECIIMGIPMQLGTGILKVRQRLQHLPEFKYQPDPIIS